MRYYNERPPYSAAAQQQPGYPPRGFAADGKACWDPPGGDCCAAKLKCPADKECVETYKCLYKLYKISHYHLYKVCPRCSQEFDYHYHLGICPSCGQ